MPDKRMVEFKDGKKVVRFASGETKEYKKEDLQEQRKYLIRHRQHLSQQISKIDEDLVKIKDNREP